MRRMGQVLLGGAALVVIAGTAGAQERTGPQPTTDRTAAALFPPGDVFRPLLADPKETVFFASFLNGSSPSRGSRTGSVGMGATVGAVRWDGVTAGDGVQVGLSGGVFAQFDLTKQSHDLINADYVVGLPVTLRRGAFSARFRLYHQSSHLGDEFVENNDVERLNLSFEALELVLSRDFGPLRGYGGGEYRFNRTPHADLKHGLLHGGLEYRHPEPMFWLGRLGAVRPVVGIDVKSWEQRDWGLGWSGRVGLELGSLPGGLGRGRSMTFFLELYDGPNPYGQFYFEDTSFVGFGAHFTY